MPTVAVMAARGVSPSCSVTRRLVDLLGSQPVAIEPRVRSPPTLVVSVT